VTIALPKFNLDLGDYHTSWVQLASPGQQLPMTSRVRQPGEKIRSLARNLLTSLEDIATHEEILRLLAPMVPNVGFDYYAIDPTFRLTWHLIGQILSGYALGDLTETSSLTDATEWFGYPLKLNCRPLVGLSVGSLNLELTPNECFALLPYLLDPLALGTRRDVLHSDAELPSRAKRKLQGIFYTPGDVARFMSSRILDVGIDNDRLRVLDPAAGAGVFLRSAACAGIDAGEYFGIDINPMAADFTSFVLLATLGADGWPTPFARWHSIRLNQLTANTLNLTGPSRNSNSIELRRLASLRQSVQDQLKVGESCVPVATSISPKDLGACFPELLLGADIILTNPPYAAVGANPVDLEDPSKFKSLGGKDASQSTNVFPLFVEQSLNFLSTTGRMAVVLPLSITFSSVSTIRNLRRLIIESNGQKEFLSFDRTPDALFGDDVKTRNTIFTLHRNRPSSVEVTGMLRWTSASRKEMFNSIRGSAVETRVDSCIPKLNSSLEVDFFNSVTRSEPLLDSWMRHVSTSNVRQASAETPSVWIAPTAYNWIGCTIGNSELIANGHDSMSAHMVCNFATEELAFAAYAVISSRTAFFLWRTTGDGFHVTSRFVKSLPIPKSEGAVTKLASVGQSMWIEAKSEPVVSVNSGRRSISFPPSQELVQKADSILLRDMRIDDHLSLEHWYRQSVVVDMSNSRRLARFQTKGA